MNGKWGRKRKYVGFCALSLLDHVSFSRERQRHIFKRWRRKNKLEFVFNLLNWQRYMNLFQFQIVFLVLTKWPFLPGLHSTRYWTIFFFFFSIYCDNFMLKVGVDALTQIRLQLLIAFAKRIDLVDLSFLNHFFPISKFPRDCFRPHKKKRQMINVFIRTKEKTFWVNLGPVST